MNPRVCVTKLNDCAKPNTGDISVDSAGLQVGSFIHSLHPGAVKLFSYPLKGRVNPPSIWHAAHLAERHSGCSGGRGAVEVVVVVVGGGGGPVWEVWSWADGPLSSVVSLHMEEEDCRISQDRDTTSRWPQPLLTSWRSDGTIWHSQENDTLFFFLLCFVSTQKPWANQGI